MNLEIQRVSKSNMGGLIDLYSACFGIDVDLDYFEWKYFQNPCGDAVAYIAVDGDKVGAFYGVIPEEYSYEGRPFRVFQSMDTMTHPDFQRRGLFVKLANTTYDAIQNEFGDCLLIGIPGMNSFPGFVRKLKWKDIHWFRQAFVLRSSFRFRTFFRSTSNCKVTYLDSLNSSLIQFLSRRKPQRSILEPILSPEFFEWRVLRHPFRNYQVLEINTDNGLTGIAVFAMDEEERARLYLVDFLELNDSVKYAPELISFIFANTNAKAIYTWSPLHPMLERAYIQSGFIANPFNIGPFSYKIPFIVRSENTGNLPVDPFQIANYDVQPLMQD